MQRAAWSRIESWLLASDQRGLDAGASGATLAVGCSLSGWLSECLCLQDGAPTWLARMDRMDRMDRVDRMAWTAWAKGTALVDDRCAGSIGTGACVCVLAVAGGIGYSVDRVHTARGEECVQQ